MPRYCCIVNCVSSSYDCSPNKQIIFQVPRNPEKREKWLKILTPHLKVGKSSSNLYVCELHFAPDDIRRNIMPESYDGTRDHIPNQIVRLKPTSVPSIFYDLDRTGIDNNETHVDRRLEQKSSCGTAIPTTFNICSTRTEKPYTLEVQPSQLDLPIEENIDISPPEIGNFELNPLPKDQYAESETVYNMDRLKNDITQLMLGENNNGWVHTYLTAGVYLMYLKDDYPNITRSLIIKDDMTVEIRIKGVVVQQHELKTIGCIQDVFNSMTAIAQKNLCLGIDGGPECSRGFTNRKSLRCNECQIEHIKRNKNERERAKRIINKKSSSKKVLKNLKNKYKRLQTNCTIMNETIENLRLSCSQISKQALEENIKNLPAHQQEAVGACFAASKCNGPNGVRYTNSWVLECIL